MVAGPDEAIEALSEGPPPAVVLFSADLTAPLVAARRIRPLAPLAQFVFLVDGDPAPLEQSLQSPVAMVGSHRSVVPLGEGELPARLQTAIEAAQHRAQLRTTIDRVNVQLASAPRSDISELKRYTASDRFLANILENAEDAIVATNTDGSIVTWNAAAERLFGIRQRDALRSPIGRVARGEWAVEIPKLVDELRSDGAESLRTSLVAERRDGANLDLDLGLSLVRDIDGEVTGLSLIARDVTEQRRLQQQVEHAERLESLGLLAGGIAHNFNNMLTAIVGNADLVLLDLPQESPMRQSMVDLRAEAMRAAELVRQMLAFAGKGGLLARELDLNRVIEALAPDLRGATPPTCEVQFQLAEALPPVHGDPVQFTQVVLNLVANAVEAVGDNEGVIAISTGVTEAQDAALAGRDLPGLPAGTYVFVDIADTGDGIDESIRERIFDPFFTTRFVGRGLGLAAVLGTAQSHGGAVDVVSVPGAGSTFRVLLPALSR